MKKRFTLAAILFFVCIVGFGFDSDSCHNNYEDKTAGKEQIETEKNQSQLLEAQPPPKISWSLERDNLIKRFKLQNDRSVNFFMYVFIEGVGAPVGYYQVNKVSSVNSQLTNTEQIVHDYSGFVLPSPAEDGSYGTNGDGVFGFTPEGIYIETNMHYITSTVPLNFGKSVPMLAVIDSDEARKLLETSKAAMNK